MTKSTWRIIRTIVFVIIGLLNTLFINPELVGTSQNYIGCALLVLALVDIIAMLYGWHKSKDA